MDTGASYTLLHRFLWDELNQQEELKPWTHGPLYLTSGEAETPLGVANLPVQMHGNSQQENNS